MTEFEYNVYKIVSKIPKGEVRTYKQIAIELGNEKLARAVGNALHKNPDNSKIPCHRVVSSNGNLSKNFAFGGMEGQKRLLENENVVIIDYKIKSH